jgi:hypothetical protein
LTQQVLVRSGDAAFFVEVADGGGPRTVSADGVFSFDGIRHALEEIGAQVVRAWQQVCPDEASVEFGLSVSAKSGKLTAVLVEGGADASLKITMKWTRTPAAPAAS